MFDFKNYLSKLDQEPQWLKDRRSKAWEKFSQLPMPLGTEESWRLLDLDLVDLENVQPAQEVVSNLAPLSQYKNKTAAYEQIKESITDFAGVLIETAQGAWYELEPELAQQGVIVTTAREAIAKHTDILKDYSGRHFAEKAHDSAYESSKFAMLNQAICANGLVVYVPKNVEIKKPFLCLSLFSRSSETMHMSRLLIIAEQHSRLSVINILASDMAEVNEPSMAKAKDNLASPNLAKSVLANADLSNAHLTNSRKLACANFLLEVFIGSGAELNYVEAQNFDENTFAIGHSYYTQAQDSRLNALVVGMGGAQLKSEIHTNLIERGAESNLNGVLLGNSTERFNFNTIEDHLAPNTTSNIDFRIALKDESQSIYHGIIQVDKLAQKTNAFLSNKNLLLSEKAHADSIPKLEILADDVKCSHGATVGSVDRKQIFYLMSRGLSAAQAEELVVNGFFHELLASCQIEGVSDWLDILVANKIAAGEKQRESIKDHPANTTVPGNKQPALTR